MSKTGENALPGNPWDIRVHQLMQGSDATQQIVRDFVILEWFLKGNTVPFTAFVLQGHVPGDEVIKYIALMMNPPEGTDQHVPFSLVISSRGRKGRRPDPMIELRGKLTAQFVECRMKEGKSYNEAVDIVTQIIVKDQIDKYVDAEPRDTVEKDYKRYKSKPQR